MGWLLIQEIQREDWVHRITEGVLNVGRSPVADVRITHATVSRKHAALSTSQSGCVLRDLGSQNGTWLNGRMITEASVRCGDRLRFGAVEVLIVDDLDEALREIRDVGSTREQIEGVTELRLQLSELTNAQRRVLRWLLRGLAEKQIAFELKLSPHTVHSHVKEIYSILAVGSCRELMAKFWTMWEEM